VLRTILIIVVILFPVSEIALAVFKRANARAASVRDRGTIGLLWVVIAVSICVAIALQWVTAGAMRVPRVRVEFAGLCLMLVGLTVRWTAIITLGRFFTVNVAVQTDHVLVDTGIYRHIRHPAYSGLLATFLGLGVISANWLSLAALVIPVTVAVLRRVAVEERVLRHALGVTYDAYRARTKRFVPGVY